MPVHVPSLLIRYHPLLATSPSIGVSSQGPLSFMPPIAVLHLSIQLLTAIKPIIPVIFQHSKYLDPPQTFLFYLCPNLLVTITPKYPHQYRRQPWYVLL